MTLKKLLVAVMLFMAASASFAYGQAQTAPVNAAPTAQVQGQAAPVLPGTAVAPDGAGLGQDLSLIGLFMQAGIVVKIIMVGLVIASVWVWAIIIDKTILFQRMKSQMDRFEATFWSGQSLEELYRSLSSRPNHAMAAIFVAAMREWKRSYEGGARSFTGLTQRLDKVMDVTIAREVERLENRLLWLATVGSAGPFVGLLGTVIGIMTSFQSIAASKNTSLAVVAPGIAEALLATAIGLFAAIPATIFYNKFVAQVNRQALRLEGFADEFSAILSRQIDERG
ncbi:protein TolQ [Ancylobacter sp. SL191]|uniref:protein TolQ n=1 Tax=Ancylobacter sp. SL191 TaxID=2995166 RepID=UPI0022707643|nr:protein TolQ [Ancylobacter sp. SL191]WAC28929.1 protein TolQ [Ancylobacter sp. SL191]